MWCIAKSSKLGRARVGEAGGVEGRVVGSMIQDRAILWTWSGREGVGESTMGERAIQSETTVKLQMYEWLRESFGIPGTEQYYGHDQDVKGWARARWENEQFKVKQL